MGKRKRTNKIPKTLWLCPANAAQTFARISFRGTTPVRVSILTARSRQVRIQALSYIRYEPIQDVQFTTVYL